jgi:hypothetical protein
VNSFFLALKYFFQVLQSKLLGKYGICSRYYLFFVVALKTTAKNDFILFFLRQFLPRATAPQTMQQELIRKLLFREEFFRKNGSKKKFLGKICFRKN